MMEGMTRTLVPVHRPLRAAALALLLAFVAIAPGARAQDLHRLLPADTALALGLRGLDEVSPLLAAFIDPWVELGVGEALAEALGGVDPAALYPAKRLFAAARNVEGPGSLTIVATALIGAGSRMDEVIVEAFVDTANMELHLDGALAQQRILPAVDVTASGTRREERLLSTDELAAVARLRRDVAQLPPEDGVPLLLRRLEAAGTNATFVAEVGEAGLT